MENLRVGLFNDSFPPMIDGVSNAIYNYAQVIQKNHGTAVVATPWYPKVQDSYPFTVYRYPSANISRRLGYRAGNPFDLLLLHNLQREKLDILHTHCPFASSMLARAVRFQTGAPVVFTYHTKFDIDIEKRVALNPVRNASIRFLLANIYACDEVWVVSNGAGENLKSLGYTGEYILMENGTDFARGRSSQERLDKLTAQYGIQKDETVFLFVGRMMWYKGVKLSLDGLREARKEGCRFKMLLVGDGADRPDMEAYVKKLGLEDCCIFAGAVRDRELLRDYFCRADLFLFPSTYDTNGIVVREAAACSCPSLLIQGSCAAEGVEDGETGVIIQQDVPSMAKALVRACQDREALARIGRNAAEKIYLSWEDAVARAVRRYEIILENHQKRNDLLARDGMYY